MLATYIDCKRCGKRFDPYRPTRLEWYNGKRCRSCGKKHNAMHVNREKQHKKDGSSYIYLMKTNGAIKIGVSKQPEKRRKQVQIGNQSDVTLVKSWYCENPYNVEEMVHSRLFDRSMSGEWFEYDTTDLTGLVNAMGLFIDNTESKIEA